MTDVTEEPTVGWIDGVGATRLRTLTWPAASPRGSVVLLHGLGEHAGRYGEVARRLNALGLDVFGHDHRGHGGSGGPRGHFRRFRDLLADVDTAVTEANRLLTPGPRFLVAHSLGGLIGLAWIQARQPKLAGAVISAPWLATAAPVPTWKRAAGRVADRIAPRLTMETGTRPEHVTSDPEMMALLEADPLAHTRMSARAFGEVLRAQAGTRGAAEAVKIHTLFIVPGADPLAEAGATLEFAARLPEDRVTVLQLPGFRHEAFNERGRDTVLDALATWLEGGLEMGPAPEA